MKIKSEIPPIPVNAPKSERGNYEYIPEPYKKVAAGLESQFNQMMIEAMNSTIAREDDLNTAESYYESMLVDERAKTMSSSNEGVGIKKMVLDQIYPERMRNKENYQAQLNYLKGNR